MRRLAVLALALVALVISHLPAADTKLAELMRTKKLKAVVSIDAKEMMLHEIFSEISSQLEAQKAGSFSVKYANGISKNQRFTYSGEKKTVEVVLDEMLGKNGLGYIVISPTPTDKALARYDGWIEVRKGNERGTAAGDEMAKADPKAKGKTPAKVAPKALTKAEPKEAMAKDEMTKDEMTKDEPKAVAKAAPKGKAKEMPAEEPAAEETPADEKPALDRAEMLERAATFQYDIAQVYELTGKKDKAMQKYRDIVAKFPTTEVAKAIQQEKLK